MLPKGSPGAATRNIINRMCVRPALYDEFAAVTPIRTNPFKLHSDFVYSNELGSHRRAILSVLIAAWMIDTHDALVPAWKSLHSPAGEKLAPDRRDTLLAELTAPPCSETALLNFADLYWKNPAKNGVERTALVNRWQSEALDRYKSVLAQIEAK
jgi:hypothetical protein